MTEWADLFGCPLDVGDRVFSNCVDDGQPLWARWGWVVGFGRTRVRVRWDAWSYDEGGYHAVKPNGLTREAAPGRRLWTCPGCGRRIDEGNPDMIVEHVRDCDDVDGAGQPVASSTELDN